MKKHWYNFTSYWIMIFSILTTTKKKAYILCHPIHSNLGDQAQLMCTDQWIKENYPEYKIIHLGKFMQTINFPPYKYLLFSLCSTLITLLVLKIKYKKKDIFIGHSGYLMVDHHSGWKMFLDIMHYFPNNAMLILPQTINFYTPYIKKIVSDRINQHKHLTLLCRDEVSYQKAQEMFKNVHILLYPDIVTSLIGTRKYTSEREGILFCMRDDIETLYSPEDIQQLIEKFKNIRNDKIDTTIDLPRKRMEKNREDIINRMIEKIASYQIVITDRYHGTIFSCIASTPVIVISSADHKLSSGVKWFPQKLYDGYIYYANDLNEAYATACQILENTNYTYNNPAYFKLNYWDALKSKL